MVSAQLLPQRLSRSITASLLVLAALTALKVQPAAAQYCNEWYTPPAPGASMGGMSGVHICGGYALSSASNNNGSAFAGLSANTPFYNTLLGICMFLARFPLAIGMLAIAGSLAAKKSVPLSAGTLPTHTPLFIVLLAMTVVVIGALTFLPALALGPVAEQLMATPLVGSGH